jgi:hypothetical protein
MVWQLTGGFSPRPTLVGVAGLGGTHDLHIKTILKKKNYKKIYKKIPISQ